MSHCPNCNHCDDCCPATDGTAPTGASTTPNTGTRTTSTGTVLSAVTDPPNPGTDGMEGKKVLIVPILSDLVSILVGHGDRVPFSPFLALAAQSVEFELSDRLMDKLDDPATPVQ